METPAKANEITSGAAAEAILAIWCQKPHQAKFLSREHFGKLYSTIFFDGLNGAQTVIAILLYRIAENHRRRPSESDPAFVRYAACFLAMQMGKSLLKAMGIRREQLDHRNFAQAKNLATHEGEHYFNLALNDIQNALVDLYGDHAISMQQLSATFRRGDLLATLP